MFFNDEIALFEIAVKENSITTAKTQKEKGFKLIAKLGRTIPKTTAKTSNKFLFAKKTIIFSILILPKTQQRK